MTLTARKENPKNPKIQLDQSKVPANALAKQTWYRVLKGHQKGIRKGEGADGLLRLTLTKAVRLIATIDFERVNTVQFISLEFIDKKG